MVAVLMVAVLTADVPPRVTEGARRLQVTAARALLLRATEVAIRRRAATAAHRRTVEDRHTAVGRRMAVVAADMGGEQ